MATKQLSYTAAQIDAAIAKVNSLITSISGAIVQLYDGSTAIYPRTKAEAVFFDNDTSKTLDAELTTVKSDIISVQKEAVYDVSAHNGGAIFESLQALLNSSNLSTLIPISIRCGGMNIRFIQGSVSNSDKNKYIQFRYMLQYEDTIAGNATFINTDNWAINSNSKLINNPVFISVLTDKDNKILIGLKRNGTVYYGIDIPFQVKQYVGKQINKIKEGTDSTAIDGLNKIISFLQGLLTSDKLETLLGTKVDKETGMSLIDSIFASSNKVIYNPEYLEIEIDKNGNLLGGRKRNGTKVEYMATETLITRTENIDNTEWLQCEIDKDKKIITGADKKGVFYFPKGIDTDLIRTLAYKKWHGKRIVCFGDSVTEMGLYLKWLGKFFDTPIYNRGNGGRSVALGGQTNSFCERVTYSYSNQLVDHVGGLPSGADLIILEGGINDWALLKTQELGDIKAPITTNIHAPREGNTLYTFAGAYMFVLAKLKEKYPNAEIYTLNIHGIQSTRDDRWKEVFFTDVENEYSGFVYNNNINIPTYSYTIEKTLEDYRKIIREASSFYGVKCIEMVNSKINFLCKENRTLFSSDGLHPNDAGAYEMAKYIINNLNIF